MVERFLFRPGDALKAGCFSELKSTKIVAGWNAEPVWTEAKKRQWLEL